ncbi:MAG: (Fe-S)-binding protein [Thermoguttaceae bacterium]|jgi:Fe-S oxidoreductase
MTAGHARVKPELEFLAQMDVAPDRKTILDCMQCGMCSGSCPLGEAMEYPPRRMILEARAGNLAEVLKSPSLWMCIGCYTCSRRCPRAVELTDGMWPAMRDKAMQEGIQPPAELQEAFQKVFKYGNSLGESPRKRMAWAENLDVPVRDLSKERAPVEVLWLVGDYPAYYPRNRTVTRAFARILTAMGIRWGVLGNKERTIGDCDRLFGEEGLFESLVEYNRKLLDEQQFETIVLLDPHGYRALEKFYPRFGAKYPVEHYTTFLADRIDQIKTLLVKPVTATATYHDNCCVGRRCGCFDPPRTLLGAIPGVTLVEMEHNRQDALCCGGGGGGMWLDGHIAAHGGTRLSDRRVREAAATQAGVLAVSCPFELSRFEDSAKVAGLDGQLKVRDLIELLAESMDLGERGTS